MKVSVVCPFYNESAIIEKSSRAMLDHLRRLPYEWELIAVNDGSTDDSLEQIRSVFQEEPRARVISAVAWLAALTSVGAAGFVLLEGLSWPDANYLTVVTLSTGYTALYFPIVLS